MRKTSSKTPKTTSRKARKTNGKAPAVKAAEMPAEAPKIEEKATKAKHAAIESGGTIQINEAVGIHFRADATTAPAEGDMVLIQVGKHEIPLIVTCTKILLDGSQLTQAFLPKKCEVDGLKAYQILGEAKGESATVIWK